MTIIEFFDDDAIENVVSALLCAPDKVIFVGDNLDKINSAIKRYTEILSGRGHNTVFEGRGITRNSLMNIVAKLTEIVQSNEDCTIDLAGGDDLYMVAVGIVYSRFPGRLQLHRFNIRNGNLYDCDADGSTITAAPAVISIEENIKAYGGRIVYDDEEEDATGRWDMNDEFISDMLAMWDICKADPGKWNMQINVLDGYSRYIDTDNKLTVSINKDLVKAVLEERGIKTRFISGLLNALAKKGLIKSLVINENQVNFTYKNMQVKKCLTKAGQILELFVTYKAETCKDKDGTKTYNDVMTGVVIDWDGLIPAGTPNVENEIDVLLMRGLIPVFISCKNGQVDVDELYKLESVAKRFGGKYAKKVLVASELDKMGKKGDYIMARAKEMNIRVIDDIDKMSESGINKAIRSLWSN